MINVPRIESRQVKSIVSKIGSDYHPEYIRYLPHEDSIVNECFDNVRKMIGKKGGSSIVGFAIWQSELIIEAEYHCIWVSPNEEKIDISNHGIIGEKKLFVRDDRVKYKGNTINNIRLNRTPNQIVDCLISVYDADYILTNYGNRAFQHKIILKGKEIALHDYFDRMKYGLELFAKEGKDVNDDCFCGKPLPFYRCHQQDISNAINELHKLLKK